MCVCIHLSTYIYVYRAYDAVVLSVPHLQVYISNYILMHKYSHLYMKLTTRVLSVPHLQVCVCVYSVCVLERERLTTCVLSLCVYIKSQRRREEGIGERRWW
jgi:hypothetical protein